MQTNKYLSYKDYISHQSEKTQDPVRRKQWLSLEWNSKVLYFTSHFKRVFDEFPLSASQTGLALGARTGQEVEAMRSFGLYAVGIDIVPCYPHVIAGDIHKIPFKDNSFDFIFSNVFDHCLYPNIFAQEIRRVASIDAIVLLHLQFGQTDFYGVTNINHANDVIKLFENDNILWNKKMDPDPTIFMDWCVLLKIEKY